MRFEQYLDQEMGLVVSAIPWRDADKLPVFLARSARYWLCACTGVEFIVAEVEGAVSLPDLKRIPSQLARWTDLPVAVVADIDARQRRALVRQGMPFIVPGRQAYLPFLGFVASAARSPRALGDRLLPGTQAALVTLIAHPDIRLAGDLRNLMKAPASSVSRSLDELERRGLISKSKEGRELVISRSLEKNGLLKEAAPYLRSPIHRVFYAKKSRSTDGLPLAGVSALAERTMIGAPAIEQRAISRKAFADFEFDGVREGELPDCETVQVQVWSYEPLVAGFQGIDRVSLALSLVGEGDERVNGQLDVLFDEEGLWQ